MVGGRDPPVGDHRAIWRKDEQESGRRATVLALIVAVMAGAVLALLTLPLLFRATSNDLSRLQALYEAFEDRGSPEIAVLGNSVYSSSDNC